MNDKVIRGFKVFIFLIIAGLGFWKILSSIFLYLFPKNQMEIEAVLWIGVDILVIGILLILAEPYMIKLLTKLGYKVIPKSLKVIMGIIAYIVCIIIVSTISYNMASLESIYLFSTRELTEGILLILISILILVKRNSF
jgi:hypothetical protein